MDYSLNKEQYYGVINTPESMLVYDGEVLCGMGNVELPNYYMLPDDRIPTVRNQLTTNMCVAFATTGVLQVLNRIEEDDGETFSPGFIYTQCRKHKGEGMFPSTTLNMMIEKGCCKESVFPYIYDVPDIIKIAEDELTDAIKEEAKNYKIAGYTYYNLADKTKNAENIKAALYTGKVPLVMITDYFGQSHAVVIIGWDNNRGRFIILNSWGEKWGRNGVGSVPYEDARAYLLIDDVNTFNKLPFEDIDKTDWYYKAVKKCYLANLMKGTSATSFEPLKTTTRAEMAQIIFNINNKQNNIHYGKVDKFKDVESNAWYNNVVAYCVLNGFMVGVSDSEFEPDRPMNKAEIAQVLYNMKDKMNISKIREYVPFNDVSEYSWYYDAVKYCYERGLINGVGCNQYEPEKEVVRAETAQIIYNYCKAIDEVNQKEAV